MLLTSLNNELEIMIFFFSFFTPEALLNSTLYLLNRRLLSETGYYCRTGTDWSPLHHSPPAGLQMWLDHLLVIHRR